MFSMVSVLWLIEPTFAANPTALSVTVDDADGDGLLDSIEVHGADGVLQSGDETDPFDADTDNDGLRDGEEWEANTDPRDADTDDDGLSDGSEACGSTDPLLQDTDGDGLGDGLELGNTMAISAGISEGIGLPFRGTNSILQLDSDPSTTTDPTLPDTDGDGLEDGAEDVNGNGRWDGDQEGLTEDETDPTRVDTDGDGLSDSAEGGSSGPDANGNGTIDALDPDGTLQDSDGDGLTDQEEAVGSDGLPDTGDETDPLNGDTDGDGLDDAQEVWGLDGVPLSGDETDPYDVDSDDDGLTDGEERHWNTDPRRRDTDGDGLADGLEVGVIAPWFPSVLSDGTPILGTDFDQFSADSDATSTTNPTEADTDGDGLLDGEEDLNRNGAWEGDRAGLQDDEADPNRADTDGDGLSDGEEGGSGGPDSDGDGTIDALDAHAGFDTPTQPDAPGEDPTPQPEPGVAPTSPALQTGEAAHACSGCNSPVLNPPSMWLLAGLGLLGLRRRR